MVRGAGRVALAALALGFVTPAGAEEVRFTLLHLNDIYEILPPKSEDDPGGLARVATLRKELRRNNWHTYTVLAGDCLSPSVMGNARLIRGGKLTGERLAGRQMVAVLNALGLDYATFGNHEFDLAEPEFRARLKESAFNWLSSNVTGADGAPLPGVAARVMFTVPGRVKGSEVRVGLVGVTIDAQPPGYVRVRNAVAAAREQARALRNEGCGVIVVVSHLTMDEDRRLAGSLPEVNLIVGGHEHAAAYEPGSRSGPPIAKAGAHARAVYIHDFTYDTARGVLTVESRLRAVDKRLEPDPATADAIERWKGVAFDGLREEIRSEPGGTKARAVEALRRAGKLPREGLTNADLEKPAVRLGMDLEGRETDVRSRPTNLTRLLTRVMREKAGRGTDVAVLNSGSVRIDDVIPASGVSAYDLFRILPYEMKVYRVRMKGRVLKRLLHEGRKPAVVQEGAFLQTDNYDEATGLVKTDRADPSLRDDETYAVAINDFLLKGGEPELADALKPRDPKTFPALNLNDDGIELDRQTEPFDLLPAVAEELARLDRPAGQADDPAGPAASNRAETEASEKPKVAAFLCPIIPRDAEPPAPTWLGGTNRSFLSAFLLSLSVILFALLVVSNLPRLARRLLGRGSSGDEAKR